MNSEIRALNEWSGSRKLDHVLPLSGFVIHYNEPESAVAAARSLSFCREVILVDKSSDAFDPELFSPWVDRVIQVPWSRIVEDTRAFALDACSEEWVLFLDADEMCSAGLVRWLGSFFDESREAWDAVWIPRKNYRFGRFSAEQFDWPQSHLRLVRKGAVTLPPEVHSRPLVTQGRAHPGPENKLDTAMVHLSYPTFEDYLAKANAYTEQTERSTKSSGRTVFEDLRERISWAEEMSAQKSRSEFDEMTHALRAFYDMILLFKDRIHDLGSSAEWVEREYSTLRQQVLSEL